MRDVVETITKVGFLTWNITSSHGGRNSVRETHSRDAWKRSLFTEVANAAMTCIEKAEARGKSKVTSDPSPSILSSLDPACSSIDDWLKSISFQAYAPKIKEYGCDSLQALDAASEQEMKEMTEDAAVGMKKFHHNVIMKAWKDRASDAEGRETEKRVDAGPERASNVADNAEEGEEAARVTEVSEDARESTASDGREEVEAELKRVQKEPEMSFLIEEDKEQEIVREDAHETATAVARTHQQWHALGAERVEECLKAAREAGGKALNTSRSNIVGEGRAGKTAWARAISGNVFV